MELEFLQSIANSLTLIAQAKAPVSQLKLGFGEAPKSQLYVFCNRGKGGVWYHLDDQSNPVIIEATALTGYARSFKIEKVIRREKEVYKMNFFLEGDRTYVLESAHDSNFSKGLMSAIAMMTPDQLRQPITICQKLQLKLLRFCFVIFIKMASKSLPHTMK